MYAKKELSMSNVFNIAEVIDMGIEKEKKRRDFYGRVAESFKESDMKNLFSRLRDWEDEHIRKFEGIRKTVNIDESQESYEGELADYMRSLVDGRKIQPRATFHSREAERCP